MSEGEREEWWEGVREDRMEGGVYRIAGKFGGEFNLGLWRLTRCIAKLKSTNISVRVRVYVC